MTNISSILIPKQQFFFNKQKQLYESDISDILLVHVLLSLSILAAARNEDGRLSLSFCNRMQSRRVLILNKNNMVHISIHHFNIRQKLILLILEFVTNVSSYRFQSQSRIRKWMLLISLTSLWTVPFLANDHNVLLKYQTILNNILLYFRWRIIIIPLIILLAFIISCTVAFLYESGKLIRIPPTSSGEYPVKHD